MRKGFTFSILTFLLTIYKVTSSTSPHAHLVGQTSAVYDLLKRVLKGKDHPFRLELDDSSVPSFYFQLKDDRDGGEGKIVVTASTASELTAGIGWYLRHFCNMVLGWPQGGGLRIEIPQQWPRIGDVPVVKKRAVEWSYFMNVCTHSYSLVWYGRKEWSDFIDWLSLTGINMVLALTGQEQIQYETFREFGVKDIDIRSWFNGPAFLTWSRGQNEYGSGIAGPLPKSWMKDQFDLQKNFILPRLRALGIIGQLPGFQGNIPIQLKDILKDENITQQGDTGWMNSLDPHYSEVADVYMKKLVDAFGTDHWYQLDGYFNGDTAPWMEKEEYIEDSSDNGHDNDWFRRGLAAYQGLNRTDPKAVWSFQGFSIIGWKRPDQARAIKGFIDAPPKDHFVVMDMSYQGLGEWTKWQNFSWFGTPFVFTALHNFGGTDGIKGDLRRLNHIPFDIMGSSSIVGVGGTPEGINQNPAYYEFLFDSTFREGPVPNLTDSIIQRSLKRYGLVSKRADHAWETLITHLSKSWVLLTQSLYSNDFSTQDFTGIAHLKPWSTLFEKDRFTPQKVLCDSFFAWEQMIFAIRLAKSVGGDLFDTLHGNNEPFRYDLVNLGRDVLAHLSTPMAMNFTDATTPEVLDQDELIKSGMSYIELLGDVDMLVGTDQGFLLGPWLESARQWGAKEANDCFSEILNNSDCIHFYEWNARCQITTWNPTPKDNPKVVGGPLDYAAKHWSGLIADYYGRRADILLGQALHDVAAKQPLNQTEVDRLFAKHAYEWTVSTKPYPLTVTGDAFDYSIAMYHKYKGRFSSCTALPAAETPSVLFSRD